VQAGCCSAVDSHAQHLKQSAGAASDLQRGWGGPPPRRSAQIIGLIRESKMDRRTTYLVLFTLSLTSGTAGLPATSSAAEGPIGVAAVVRNSVSQLEPRATRIAKGDEVVRNEVVRTAADSDARFVLRDDTNLSLGPNSTLKLDRIAIDHTALVDRSTGSR